MQTMPTMRIANDMMTAETITKMSTSSEWQSEEQMYVSNHMIDMNIKLM